MFESFLALNGGSDVIETFVINEAMKTVALRKAFLPLFAMFVDTAG